MKYRLDDGQLEVVDEAVAEILRKKTPGERMMLAGEAWCFAREWITAGVRCQFPESDEAAVRDKVNRRLLGEPG